MILRKTFRHNLLSVDEIYIRTNRNALQSAFQKRDVPCMPVKLPDLIAHYRFKTVYPSGSLNQKADYLSQLSRNYKNELGLILPSTRLEDVVFAKNLLDRLDHISFMNTKDLNKKTLKSVKENVRNFASWEDRRFPWTRIGLRVIAPIPSCQPIVQSLHYFTQL